MSARRIKKRVPRKPRPRDDRAVTWRSFTLGDGFSSWPYRPPAHQHEPGA